MLLNFDDSPFLCQLTKERIIHFKRKLLNMVNEICLEIGSSSTMEGFRKVLVKLVLFQSEEGVNFQMDAMPSFAPD